MTALNWRAPPRDTWKTLVDRASALYLAYEGSRFPWGFARGKLTLDPVFRYLLEHGLSAPHSRVLDIGCGQGLLASLLRAVQAQRCDAADRAKAIAWPEDWASAPTGVRVTGIELMPRDVVRARVALRQCAEFEFICGDMRRIDFASVDTVVILDVLHYIAIAEQDAVLARARAALPLGGRLLLRVGDANAGLGFRISQWVDHAVTAVRGHQVGPRFGRPLAAWTARLAELGFQVHCVPMSRGTPFANVLLVAEVVAEVVTEGHP